MGLAPQIVQEVFEIVKVLNTRENVSFLLAEQNTHMALRFAATATFSKTAAWSWTAAPSDWPRTRTSRSSTSALRKGTQEFQ